MLKLQTLQLFIKPATQVFSVRTFNLRKKGYASYFVFLTKKFKMKWTKIYVLGNFFKLTFRKKKLLTKFNLCFAHRLFIYKNIDNNLALFKKIKKNKLLFLHRAKKSAAVFYSLYCLFQKRTLNSYTKKGIKLSNMIFKQKVGKKTTY